MKESDLQNKIMVYLNDHPKVAWCMVTTTGMVKSKGFRMTVGFPGLSDIIGQLTDGRTLAIEVKLPGKKPTSVQESFLQTVSDNSGVSGWVDSVEGLNGLI